MRPHTTRAGLSSSARQTIAQATGFGYRYIRALGHRPIGLLWILGFPAAFYAITIATFIDFGSIPEAHHGAVRATTALSYGVFGAVLVSLTTVSGGLLADLETNRTAVYRSIGVSPLADLLGRVGSAVTIALASIGVVLLVSLLTDATYTFDPASMPIVVVAVLGSVLPWIVIAYAIAIVTDSRRYATLVAISLALASYFATGFNGTVPASFTADPMWLNLLPNTLSTRVLVAHAVGLEDAAAAGLTPPSLPTARRSLGLLAGYAFGSLLALYAIGSARLYDGGFE